MGVQFRLWNNTLWYNPHPPVKVVRDHGCGSGRLGPLPWRCFYWKRGGLMCGGVWGWGSMTLWQHCLYGWVSCMCAGGGWLAGCLPEKLVGMQQGQGRGRRQLPSLLTNKPMFVFVYLKSSRKANSDAKLLFMALLGFEETGGILAACCSAQGCCWVSGLAGKLNGQRLIKTGDAPPPLFPTRHLKSPPLPPSPTPAVEYIQGPCSRLLFSSIFHSLLSSAFVWVTVVVGLFKWPPSPVPQPLFGLKAMLFMTGTTCRRTRK